MVSSSTCMISIRPPVWRQVHSAPVVKPPAVPRNLPFDHITSHAQKKVRRFYFMFGSFTWLRAFAQEPFLTYEHETTTLINILLL
jgi:hypothetical protein